MLLIQLWPGLILGRSLHRRGSQLWLSCLSPLSTTRLPWGRAGTGGRQEQMAEPHGVLSWLLLHREREPWSPEAGAGTVCVGLSPSCSILWPGCSLSWLPGPAQLSSFCCSVGPRGAWPCTHNWGVIPVGLCPLCPLVGAFLEFWHHTGKCPWLSSHLPQSSVGLCQAAKGGTGL